MGDERGLTLLEVVIALLLFAMMSVFLLGGLSDASDSTRRAKIQRDMAELLAFRLNIVALHYKDYDSGDEGEFPASGSSNRLVDEEEIFGTHFAGYTGRVEMEETVGTGATGPVIVGDGDTKGLLFQEEGAGTVDNVEEDVNVEEDEVDQMLFIRVTVFPPGYEEGLSPEEEDRAARPHSAWTAILLPADEAER